MINLLSESTLKQYRAARTNIQLRSYLIAFLFTFIAVTAVFGTGLYLTLSDRAIAKKQHIENERASAEYAAVKTQAESFSSNLKTAKSILSQEVLYSDMVSNIARVLPPNAVLSALSLDKETLTKPVSLGARVLTKESAIELKTALEDSPLFENVNINSISEEDISDTETDPIKIKFPVVVTISVTVTQGQPGSLLP